MIVKFVKIFKNYKTINIICHLPVNKCKVVEILAKGSK